MNNHDIGDFVRVQATFVDSGGTQVDPSSLFGLYGVVKPYISNVTTIPYGGTNSLVKLGTGVYYTDIPVNSSGEYHYRFRGYGANAAAVEGKFQVLDPVLGP